MKTFRIVMMGHLLCAGLIAQTNPLPPTDQTARDIFQGTFAPQEEREEPVFETTTIEMMASRQESDLEPQHDPVFSIKQESHEPTADSSNSSPSIPSLPSHETSQKSNAIALQDSNPLSPELNAGLDALMETKWTLRDKIVLGVNIALWGGSYYFLQKGITNSWINDFFNTCSNNDLTCFMWLTVQSHTRKKLDHVMEYGVIPNVCIAWSFYVISRLMECAERYLPAPNVLTNFHQEQPLQFKIKSGLMDTIALVMGGILGVIPAISYYTDLRLGNFPTKETFPFVIPLGAFLMMETIITFKILKDQLIHASLLKTGESGLKNALIEHVDKAKHALFHQSEHDLRATYHAVMNQQNGFEKLAFLLRLTPPETQKAESNIRFYTKVAASVLAFGATAYIAYLSASDGMAALYDTIADGFNFLGGISPHNQKTLEYFNTYAPNPETAPDSDVLAWFNTCMNNAFSNMVFEPGCNLTIADIYNLTEWDAGSSSSSVSYDEIPILCTAWAYFGETCAGVLPATLAGFYVPADILRSADNARSWLFFILDGYQYDAGTTSTDPVPASAAALRFGQGMGAISALFTTALTTFQTGRVVDGLFDLFSKNPKNAEAGRKSKIFNGVNLAFSTFEAAFRTLPIAMIMYFAMQDRVPNAIFWPLLVANCLVTMCTFINYFFDHYQKLPAVVQQAWWVFHALKAKVFNTPLDKEPGYHNMHAVLQNKLDCVTNHVAKMTDDNIKALTQKLAIAESEEEKESPIETLRIIAEGL